MCTTGSGHDIIFANGGDRKQGCVPEETVYSDQIKFVYLDKHSNIIKKHYHKASFKHYQKRPKSISNPPFRGSISFSAVAVIDFNPR